MIVPGRNLVFLTFAAIVAYQRGLKHIVTGVCETDYGGYPDCRDDTIKALQTALNRGMESRFVLHAPLMWRDKPATWTQTPGYPHVYESTDCGLTTCGLVGTVAQRSPRTSRR